MASLSAALDRHLGMAAAAGFSCCHAPSVAFDAVAVDLLRNNFSGLSE
jgi:hypothetical protein